MLPFARYGGDHVRSSEGNSSCAQSSGGPAPFQYLALYEVEGDPEEILARFGESFNAGQITSSPALDPVFSGNFYEAIGGKVVKR